MKIHTLTATDLLNQLESRALTSVQIVEALNARADAIEGKVNALAIRLREEALAAARHADDARVRNINLGPLHGLPITIKESIATRGSPVTLGVLSHRGEPAIEDAVVVRSLREAGAIVLGKTNISQTLLFHESDNPVYGRTSNPWNLARVPGGSSGGEAAAIAAGISPAGVGTDIGGSIRVPAAFCGIAGLKPTLDRWSMEGCVGAMPGQELIRAQCGPMARTARDVALLFRAADSYKQTMHDPIVPPVITPDPTNLRVDKLTVGVFEDDGFFRPAASVLRAVREAAAMLRGLGVTVIQVPAVRSVELTYLYFAALSSDGGKTLEHFLRGDSVVPQLHLLRTVAKMPSLVRRTIAAFMASQGEQRVEQLLEVVHEKRVEEVWQLAARRNALRREILETWDHAGIDAIICPAHPTPALWHGQSKDFSLAGCYSMYFNTLNFPAGVVPVSRVKAEETRRPAPVDRLDKTAARVERDSAGLPLGVQIAARPHREEIVLALMIALEDAARTWPAFPVTPVDP